MWHSFVVLSVSMARGSICDAFKSASYVDSEDKPRSMDELQVIARRDVPRGPMASVTVSQFLGTGRESSCKIRNDRWLRYASGSGFDPWVLFIGSLVLVPLLALLRQSSERSRKGGKEVKMSGKHVLNLGNRKAKSAIRTFGSYVKETVWAGGAGLLATPLAS